MRGGEEREGENNVITFKFKRLKQNFPCTCFDTALSTGIFLPSPVSNNRYLHSFHYVFTSCHRINTAAFYSLCFQ